MRVETAIVLIRSMAPSQALPIADEFLNPESYVESLLNFTASSTLFQTFCGRIHILNFLVQEPDLYSTILPLEWQSWFAKHDVEEILYLLVKGVLHPPHEGGPPESLIDFINEVRRHSLDRNWATSTSVPHLPHHVSIGMKQKKIHEVQYFAEYVNDISLGQGITHLVDFGSGQNYLGRVLASSPYNKRIIAIESKKLNIESARSMDVTAGLAAREKVMRDKKEYRSQQEDRLARIETNSTSCSGCKLCQKKPERSTDMPSSTSRTEQSTNPSSKDQRPKEDLKITYTSSSSIQYIEHTIKDGNLSGIISQVAHNTSGNSGPCSPQSRALSMAERGHAQLQQVRTLGAVDLTGSSQPKHLSLEPALLVMALHSCGNLLHHGVQSILLNPSVKIIVLVGCCYNLVTEKLSPRSFKIPSLRPPSKRAELLSSASDPQGFPMSEKMSRYNGVGVHLNITARMMALQAPQNWTRTDCEAFFKRHFFRALLQRILCDKGIVPQSTAESEAETDPIIIGSLRKSCYHSFTTYVRGALVKLSADPSRAELMNSRLGQLKDEEIQAYELKYRAWKKRLSIIWCLMAFSAQLAEAIIVVDRWLFLKENSNIVGDCWVEPVFDYSQSPRNLAIVGIKRGR